MNTIKDITDFIFVGKNINELSHYDLLIINADWAEEQLAKDLQIMFNKNIIDKNTLFIICESHQNSDRSSANILIDYLKKENINFFKLTGQTKVEQRMEMVNEFNTNDNIKVFLISLKAGGTGLNLIGADMVIHYDPWWNLSAENQATDRTYRIGQKRNVQVYKLITKNSIEEKIYNLQERKAKLADDMLSTKETFISRLSKDEIMDLFE